MLPAREGDCLLIGYGTPGAMRHVLIDAGRDWTYKNALAPLLAQQGVETLELLVVTHVDRDHIDGMLALLRDPALEVRARNVWFNTWDHLGGGAVETVAAETDLESFGAKMGEELSGLIVARHWPWNAQFRGAAVELAERQEDNLIRIGPLTLTLLSPGREKLAALQPVWEKECRKAGITPGAILEEYQVDEEDEELEAFGAGTVEPIDIEALAAELFSADTSRANGSSIAFLLDYAGHRALLAGDAHEDLLVRQLRALGASPTAPLEVDAFKLPHHGSKFNVSKDLLELLRCEHYLVSTNGNYFKHPDDVAMARLVKFGSADSTIHFNYETPHNRHWRNPDWQRTYRYRAEYPDAGRDGYKTLVLGD
jgi:beta-lactamase superfamily II metal-dependent hydrolase